MRIYLAQHGQAKQKDVDPDRHLTEKGIDDVKKVASFLRQFKLSVGSIWHSGKARAAQTANILASSLAVGQDVIQHDGLAPNDPITPVKEEIMQANNDLMIVGHLPFLSKLASSLLVGDESKEVVAFQQGGVVCIGCNGNEQRWKVYWMMVPELLP